MDDDYQYYRGERCGIEGCRSRRYRTNESGFEECERGHQHGLAKGDIAEDADEWSVNLRGKKSRAKSEERTEFSGKTLRGKEGFEHYLLCYQLILRKQVWWLVREKRLPEELESIVHDLWALRIQNLKSRMDFNPADGGSDTDTQASMFSSQETTDTEYETDESSKRSVKTSSAPNMIQSLALLYIATQTLRLPVLLGDFISWATSGTLLYHRAIMEIPREMRDRLPGSYHSNLDPQTHLTSVKLLHAVTALFLLFNKDYGMTMPALNVPLHLFRLVEELALPLEVYPAVRRLAAFLKNDFLYPDVSKKRIHISDFPEAQLVSCIIITTKLFYGFDGVSRHPTIEASPAAATIDWEKWGMYIQKYKQKIGDTGPLGYEDAMKVTDMDTINMSDSKIDDYLDFYAKTWTIEDPNDKDQDVDFRRMMLKSFPVGSRSTVAERAPDFTDLKNERVRSVQATLLPTKVITTEEAMESEEAVIRPGEEYKAYRNKQNLEGHAQIFFEAVAEVSGLPLRCIVRAVVFMERQLTRLKPGRAKGKGREDRVDTEDLLDDEESVINSD